MPACTALWLYQLLFSSGRPSRSTDPPARCGALCESNASGWGIEVVQAVCLRSARGLDQWYMIQLTIRSLGVPSILQSACRGGAATAVGDAPEP